MKKYSVARIKIKQKKTPDYGDLPERIGFVRKYARELNEELGMNDGRFDIKKDFFIFFKEEPIGVITLRDTLTYTPKEYAEKIVRQYIDENKGQNLAILE